MDINNLIPIPDLNNCKRILCVQPHPDDNEVGAGATIARLVNNGCEVIYLTVTDGRMGTSDPNLSPEALIEIRKKEMDNAAKLLGVSKMISLGYPDASFLDGKELTHRIVSVIREVQPDIIMTADPYLPYEFHPDHKTVGMAVGESCMFSSLPHFHPVNEDKPSKPWSVQAVAFYYTAFPNTFINVDATWDTKFKAIAVHKSQFDEQMLGILDIYLNQKAMEYAAGKDFIRAEAFKVLAPIQLHCWVDSIHL